MQAHLPITLVLAAVVAGAVFLPVQPLYASSDSMAPTMETGDLYFVLEDGPVRDGDIIAFESADRDELVTHRVVGEKAGGYVTKGDANPTTDQAGGHPVVSRSAVVGTVVEVNGRPLTVAGVGPVAARLVAVRWGLIGLGVLGLLVLWGRDLFGDGRGVPARHVITVGDVLTPLFVAAGLVGVLFVYWGASSHDLTYVASAGEITAVHTVPVGEAVLRTVSLDLARPPFTTLVVEAEGVTVLERTTTTSGVELLVRVPAQASTGPYRAAVSVATYPATLPRAAIEWLHGVHWLAAAVGTMAPLFAPVYLTYLVLVDTRMPVRGPTSRWLRRVGGS